jgi:cysteine synthase B
VLEVALRVAATMDLGKIVIILADGGWKYMSEDHWMAKLPMTLAPLKG